VSTLDRLTVSAKVRRRVELRALQRDLNDLGDLLLDVDGLLFPILACAGTNSLHCKIPRLRRQIAHTKPPQPEHHRKGVETREQLDF